MYTAGVHATTYECVHYIVQDPLEVGVAVQQAKERAANDDNEDNDDNDIDDNDKLRCLASQNNSCFCPSGKVHWPDFNDLSTRTLGLRVSCLSDWD